MKKDERNQATLRLPSDLKEAIAVAAVEMGVSFNAMVMFILREYLLSQHR